MTIASTVRRNDYVGNNVTTSFPYTFKVLAETDLSVTTRDLSDVETSLVLGTDYTVSGVGELAGGSVTLLAGPLATNFALTVRGLAELLQETDIRNQGNFYPEAHETAFDRACIVDQQQQDEIDRSVKLPDTVNSMTFNPELPAGIAGAISKAPVTNLTGDGWAEESDWPSATDIAGASGYAAAASASATAAAGSAVSAAASAVAADASAQAAQAAVDSIIWSNSVFLTFANSPLNIVDADNGTLFVIDTTGGAFTVNLPLISTLTLSGPWAVGIKKQAGLNNITINRAGTDLINGSASPSIISTTGGGNVLVPDDVPAPDEWTTIDFGTTGLAPGSVGNTELAADAVTTDKILDGTIVLADLSTTIQDLIKKSITTFIRNTADAIGTTFAAINLGTAGPDVGTPVSISASINVTFPWVGVWEAEVIGGVERSGGGGDRSVMCRLRNTTDSTTLASSAVHTEEGGDDFFGLGKFVMRGEVTDIAKVYQVQVASTNTSTNWYTATVNGQVGHAYQVKFTFLGTT